MKDTVRSLLESSIHPFADKTTKNRLAFSDLRPISEDVADLMKFTPQKVIVNKIGDVYALEYASNIERLAKDQDMTISEAVTCVANMNNILVEDCVLILDESVLETDLNVNDLVHSDNKFMIARK